MLIDSWFTKSNSIGLVRQEVFDKYSGAFSRTILLEKPTENGFYAKILVVDESIYNHEKEEIDDFCFCCGTRIKGRKASFPSTIISFGSSYTDSYDEDFFDEDTEETTEAFSVPTSASKTTFTHSIQQKSPLFKRKRLSSLEQSLATSTTSIIVLKTCTMLDRHVSIQHLVGRNT